MVKLGCKRGGKPSTGTVRLGFQFGLGDPDNPSLNLKSRKRTGEKKCCLCDLVKSRGEGYTWGTREHYGGKDRSRKGRVT